MSATQPKRDKETFRDSIATVDKKGNRIWLYPKKPKGWHTNLRTYLSWILLAVLFGMPFIKVNGDPLMLFDVINRNFIILGIHFGPQDLYLFALAMLTFVIFIALFTVVFGRLFCGWVCPQTIFMEMVYRKIEFFIEGDANAQRRLNKAPWTKDKIFKKTIKHLIFFGIAVLIANTFLSYILGIDKVKEIITDPIQQHFTGFLAMLVFSGLFYGVFAWMREQVCVAVCPYGRMQGVLLDESSIVVAYDYVRGEPRGKVKKSKSKKTANPLVAIQSSVEQPIEKIENQMGDCVDCKLCVRVCPTGIDIRNGTQLECVNCTACIDACDEIMTKVNRPTGLIRYDSEKGIREGDKKIFTPRVIGYSFVLLALLALQGFLFLSRNDVDVLLLRAPGTLYQELKQNQIRNIFSYQLSNKTSKVFPVEFRMKDGIGAVTVVGGNPSTKKNGITDGVLFVDYPKDKITSRKMEVKIEILQNGKVLDETSTNFLGPEK
ncbi:MAG TPA: cytochrome c oxidase accessory protein CcoG [Phaeodactylibacter sp.]|nr:cytochrome c oxidase accessory protein CcoG [Phaeodactylibacter sp.]